MKRYSRHVSDDVVSVVAIVAVLAFRYLGLETITPQQRKRKQGSLGVPQGL